MKDEFIKWAGNHKYLPIIERDFYAVWCSAWIACLDKVDKEMEGIECSNALRDHIQENCK
jgi:hypothetical protein